MGTPKLLDECLALAAEFVAKPAITVAQIKKCPRRGLEMPFRDALLMEQEAFMALATSEEVVQLMQAYINETGQDPEKAQDRF